jgi:hypothetical protein
MPHPVKLATCCYCGRRTALQLTARGGHELACGSCGAPLHEMKAMPMAAPVQKPAGSRGGATAGQIVAHAARPRPKKQRKARKPFWRQAVEEVWEAVEDIFD